MATDDQIKKALEQVKRELESPQMAKVMRDIDQEIERMNASEAARALRAIPSEKRAQASRENGRKGGRKPKMHVYGWYNYRDDIVVEFRYPLDRESDLKQNGKWVIIEVRESDLKPNGKWTRWLKRRARVNWGGGNYTVTPAR